MPVVLLRIYFWTISAASIRNSLNLSTSKELAKGGKVGAGYLIDLHGLKGKAIGGAKISLEHANFIVNTGHATAKDVMELVDFVKKEILVRFKVELEEEIVLLK
jgi:UDP-N-acetylenolpyruvoylglucosamine reductase